MKLYHGTNHSSAVSICSNGIDLRYSKPYLDFGQGFYLTDIEEQAQNMPIAASQYWNCIHGRELREADRDEEGKQTMRVLARNMTFLMKSIELGKKQLGLPEKEEHAFTHFIR